MKTAKSIDLSQATIKSDSCGLSYKGHFLELGQNYEEWEKILGTHDREAKGHLIWDKLGISVIIFWDNDKYMKQKDYGSIEFIRKRPVDEIYIFFLNLESPEAKLQELNHARSWKERSKESIKETEEWAKEMRKLPEYSSDDDYYKIKIQVDELYKENYVYPFTTYQGYVNLHGGPVKKGMKIDEINAYREDLSFSSKFGYVDDDIDGVNDSGVTEKTYGGDYRAKGTVCKDGRLQYCELTFTASGSLEYMKIARESKEDYKSRLRMEKDWKESQKQNKDGE